MRVNTKVKGNFPVELFIFSTRLVIEKKYIVDIFFDHSYGQFFLEPLSRKASIVLLKYISDFCSKKL